MCNVIYLSTTSDEDLSAVSSDRLRFEPITEDDDPGILALLEYPHKWYLTREFGGCSCHFRHDRSISGWTGEAIRSFEPPQDWCPEDSDNIEATLAAYEVLMRILASGYRLDLVDVRTDTN